MAVEFAMVTHAGLHQLACIVMYTFHPSATQAQAQHSLHRKLFLQAEHGGAVIQ